MFSIPLISRRMVTSTFKKNGERKERVHSQLDNRKFSN